MTQCENMGSIVGDKQCPNESTHRVVITDGDDDYESFLCPACFTGFREEMVKRRAWEPATQSSGAAEETP